MFLLFPILRRLLYLAIVLAALAIGGELLARKLIGDAVTHAVEARIGVAPKIGFGSTPLLVQIAHGKLDEVSVSAQGARIDGLGPLALTGTLHDVHLSSLTSLEGAIGSLSVQARLPPAGLRGLLATRACVDSLPASVLEGLSGAPRIVVLPGRVDLLPPVGRAVELRLDPYAAGSTVRFALSALELDGAPAPQAELEQVRASIDCSRTLSDLPFGVALVSAKATDGALALAFSGTGASFSAA
jgi:hypothetical protein